MCDGTDPLRLPDAGDYVITVSGTDGAIGYVELAYANQNKLPIAAVKNQTGKFVEPTIESTTAAAA